MQLSHWDAPGRGVFLKRVNKGTDNLTSDAAHSPATHWTDGHTSSGYQRPGVSGLSPAGLSMTVSPEAPR